MHQTRSEVIKQLPLPRKGNKYVARARLHNSFSVPVVIAIRDMLKLAKTSKEVKHMIHNKLLKLNGKLIYDLNQPVTFFSILHADKNYRLTILSTGRFSFEETKDSTRIARVIGKTAVRGKAIQYNMHDGTNVISKEKINVGDSLVLDFENKIKKHIALEKGKKAFVFSGHNVGKSGTIAKVSGTHVTIDLDEKEAVLDRAHVIVE